MNHRAEVKAMAKIKKESKAAPSQTCSGERTTRFRDYNLEGLPHEALPFKGMDYKGKHSYTVCIGEAAPQPKKERLFFRVVHRVVQM